VAVRLGIASTIVHALARPPPGQKPRAITGKDDI
jgi:hypothetical protein